MPDRTDVEGLPEQAPEKPSAKYPTRELGRLIKYYREKVRNCNSKDQIGVIRNIQRMIDSGIALEDIATALENYEAARKGQDPQYTMMLRSFFSEAKIREWINPVRRNLWQKPTLPTIDFQPLVRPQPVTPESHQQSEEHDEL